LPGYDYTQAGAYFVTFCAHHGEPLFGEVVGGVMRLNRYGRIVQACWADLPRHYPHVVLDEFVVMPTHTHKIIILAGDPNADAPAVAGAASGHGAAAPPRHALSEIVRALKTFSARRINELRGTPGIPVWQRDYWEHIIRDDRALEAIRRYIRENPARWGSRR
jgi:REP element-mobilizing transposase RayT